jgi:hypothetical protein
MPSTRQTQCKARERGGVAAGVAAVAGAWTLRDAIGGFERSGKIIDVAEIVHAVPRRNRHDPLPGQAKHDMAEVQRGGDIPSPKNGLGQKSPLAGGQFPQPMAKLPARNMPGNAAILGRAVNLVNGISQPLLHELVSGKRIDAKIASTQNNHLFFHLARRRHGGKYIMPTGMDSSRPGRQNHRNLASLARASPRQNEMQNDRGKGETCGNDLLLFPAWS